MALNYNNAEAVSASSLMDEEKDKLFKMGMQEIQKLILALEDSGHIFSVIGVNCVDCRVVVCGTKEGKSYWTDELINRFLNQAGYDGMESPDSSEVLRHKVQTPFKSKYEKSNGKKRMSYKQVATGLTSSSGLTERFKLRKASSYGLSGKMAVLSCTEKIEVFDTAKERYENRKSSDEQWECNEGSLEDDGIVNNDLPMLTSNLHSPRTNENEDNEDIDVKYSIPEKTGMCAAENHCLKMSPVHNTHEEKNVNEFSEINVQYEQNGGSKTHLQQIKEEIYECEHCGENFDLITLRTHLGIKTKEAPFQCEHCGKKFNYRSHLKRHLRMHTGETPYECELCGKKFKERSHVKTHLKIHTGEKPYECDYCGMKFNLRSNLKRHVRIHTGETPYECEYCGMAFNQHGSLKVHLRIHTRETPFECEDCGKKCKDKNQLKTHLRIHTGERPFECQHCEKKFKDRSQLRKHFSRIHTRETPYECEHCGKKYKSSYQLKKHLRMHTEMSCVS